MHQKIVLSIVLIVGLICALIVGINIGTADYEQMAIYAAIACSIYFVVHGWKNVWWVVALLIFSGATFKHSFDFDARHLFTILIVCASVISFINHNRVPTEPLPLLRAGSRITAILMALLLAYGGIHFIVYYTFPYSPTDYLWKSSTKAYFQAFAPIFCFLWLLSGSYTFRLKPNWSKLLVGIIFLCLLANIAVMAVMFHLGYSDADDLFVDPRDYSLYVPLIKLAPSIYTLRALCPAATVLVLMIATSPGWWASVGKLSKLTVILAIPAIIAGSIYSGGRATPIFCVVLAVCVALKRKKIHLVAVISCIGALLAAGANIFSHEINTKAPVAIARSMQLVMVDKSDLAYGSVTHSQDSRTAAFHEAIDLWRKDNRVLFFGRSVFGITQTELLKSRYEGIDEFVDTAVRTGATHNLLTDLLLQYGLTGCTLYLLGFVFVIRFFWRLSKAIPPSEPLSRSLAEAMAIYLPLLLIGSLLGGGFLPMEAALIIGLIRASILQSVGSREAAANPIIISESQLPVNSNIK